MADIQFDHDVLRAGLAWLFETEQPDGAILQHHGLIHDAEGDRRYCFVPEGAWNRPVVVIDIADPKWSGPMTNRTLLNPLAPTELEQFAEAIAALGYPTAGTWNGHPGPSGSVSLSRTAHPSLLAAVNRYRAGCPAHPARRVFCDCGWYRDGFSLLIQPALSMSGGRS